MRLFEDLHVDFLSKRKFFYILSAVLLLAGLVDILFFRGLHFGIDFNTNVVFNTFFLFVEI